MASHSRRPSRTGAAQDRHKEQQFPLLLGHVLAKHLGALDLYVAVDLDRIFLFLVAHGVGTSSNRDSGDQDHLAGDAAADGGQSLLELLQLVHAADDGI